MAEIFNLNFESRSVGAYTRSMIDDDWNDPIWVTGPNNSATDIVTEDSSKVFRGFLAKDEISNSDTGFLWPHRFGTSYDELWLKYKVKFESGFDWSEGGKLPGLMGGTRPDGGPVSGGYDPTGADGMSARLMWLTNGTAICYLYHKDQSGTYADNVYLNETGSNFQFTAGTWHTVVQQIIINDVGSSNGEVNIWVDGTLRLNGTGYEFRTVSSWSVDGIYMALFRGGGTAAWESDTDHYVFFDEFVASTTSLITGTPTAPSGLTATPTSSSQINLSWTDNSSDETGFKIERGGVQIATVSANTTSYSDTGLAASTLYNYKVRAYNASGNSSYATASGTTQAAVTTPTILTNGTEVFSNGTEILYAE